MNKFSDKNRKHVRHCEAFSAEAIQKKITLDCFIYFDSSTGSLTTGSITTSQ